MRRKVFIFFDLKKNEIAHNGPRQRTDITSLCLRSPTLIAEILLIVHKPGLRSRNDHQRQLHRSALTLNQNLVTPITPHHSLLPTAGVLHAATVYSAHRRKTSMSRTMSIIAHVYEQPFALFSLRL